MKLIEKIKKKNLSVGVIGLGYVGLELLLNISESNINVFGFDKNKLKISKLKKNIPVINTVSKKRLKNIKKSQLFNNLQIHRIQECDIIIICVPTPLTLNQIPDMSFIKNCFNSIKKYLRKEQMIILESTVYPGATREIFLKELKKIRNLNVGKNFFLCFSPERISPGKDYDIKYSDIMRGLCKKADQPYP